MSVFAAALQTLLATAMTSALLASAPASSGAANLELLVPFGCGLSFPVSQAHNTGSHTYNDVWAWDFRMPEGTPVVAALAGVVRMARGDSATGGCDPAFAPFANYVVVSHPGGRETQYLHFREVVVKAGDRVKAGQILGYSGMTGWACGAHLHFKLAQQKSIGWNNPSVPARIKGYGDPQVDTEIVAPACHRDEIQIAGNETTNRAPPSAPSAEGTRRSPQTSTNGFQTKGVENGRTVPASSHNPSLAQPATASSGPI